MDDEAPIDPGFKHKIYTEQDFEGNYSFIFHLLLSSNHLLQHMQGLCYSSLNAEGE